MTVISSFVRVAGGFALIGSAGAAMAAGSSPTPVAITLATATYTQNFNSLVSTGTSNVLPAGFQLFEGATGAAADGSYVASTGSTTDGGAYSFGAANAVDRALGSIGSGGATPIYYGAFFTNGLSATITGLDFSYVGEQWRTGDAADGLSFQYSFDATPAGGISGGTWTSIASLAFSSPNVTTTGGAINGNDPANRSSLAGSLANLTLANGAGFAIRWVDLNTTGTDDGVAADDFSLTATTAAVVGVVPEPATWALMLVGFGLAGSALRRRAHVAVASC